MTIEMALPGIADSCSHDHIDEWLQWHYGNAKPLSKSNPLIGTVSAPKKLLGFRWEKVSPR